MKLYMKRIIYNGSFAVYEYGLCAENTSFCTTAYALVTEKENTLTTFALPIEKGAQVEDVVLAFKTKHRMVDLANLSVYASTRNKREAATLFAQTTKIRKKLNFQATTKQQKTLYTFG